MAETSYPYSTGISLVFNGVTIYGVYDLNWSWGTGPSAGRSEEWNSDGGGCSFSVLGYFDRSFWNVAAPLTITGGAADISVPVAVCTSIKCQPELNGITRHTVELKWIF